MEEYKGIYYGDESERKFFEGGAHFKYIKLYKALEKIALERNLVEKEQEIYIHKKNNINNYLKNKISNEKKSRNIQSYIDSNKITYNTQLINNQNLNYTFNIKQEEVNLSLNNNTKNKLTKNFSIKNQKKMLISRNKESMVLFKGKPNTINKDGVKGKLFVKKNNLISTSMEQTNKDKNINILSTNLKKSVPDLYNLNSLDRKINNYFAKKSFNKSNYNIKKDVNTRNIGTGLIKNISYYEENKLSLKTERLNLIDDEEKEKEKIKQRFDEKFKSQYNFNDKIGYANSIGVVRKGKKKIKKGVEENNKNMKERAEPNIISEINKILIKKSNSKNEKKEIVNKTNKKKNIRQNFDSNAFIKKINFNNEFMRIINEKGRINKMKINTNKNNYINNNSNTKTENAKNINISKNNINKLNLNQLSFNNKIKGKTRNFNQIDISFQTKKSTIKKDNNILNSTRNKNTNDFKNLFKTMVQMKNKNNNNNQNSQKKQGNQNLIYKSLNNFIKMNNHLKNNHTPIGNKNSNFNPNKINNMNKLIKPYNQNKSTNINISFKNDGKNINDFKNKTLNNNKNASIGVYIKPKQSCCLKKNGCINNVNIDKNNCNILSFNFNMNSAAKKIKI